MRHPLHMVIYEYDDIQKNTIIKHFDVILCWQKILFLLHMWNLKSKQRQNVVRLKNKKAICPKVNGVHKFRPVGEN